MLHGNDEILFCAERLNGTYENRKGVLAAPEVHALLASVIGGFEDTSGRRRLDPDLEQILFIGRHDRFVDDLTVQALPREFSKEARAKELGYFKEKGVWLLKQISEAARRTGKRPITVRWF